MNSYWVLFDVGIPSVYGTNNRLLFPIDMFCAICQFAQLFINCANHRAICKLHVHMYLLMEQAFANEARERLSSALKCRYGPKKLKRLTLVRARPYS